MRTFNYREQYLGGGDLDAYDFGFKVTDEAQLLIVVVDDDGAEVMRVRGDDLWLGDAQSYVDSVDLNDDQVNEPGGTINFVDEIPDQYTLIILLADDEPTQPDRYRNSGEFTLNLIELSLDRLSGQIQRAITLAQRSFKLHEADDADAISTLLPPGFADNPGSILFINDDGDGWEYGITMDDFLADVAAAAASAASASTSATASASSATASAASASAAATSATASAASATAAAASVAPHITATRAAPTSLAAAGVIATGDYRFHTQFVKGDSAVRTCTIANPTAVGDRLILVGCHATNAVLIVATASLILKNGSSDLYLFDDTAAEFVAITTGIWMQLA